MGFIVSILIMGLSIWLMTWIHRNDKEQERLKWRAFALCVSAMQRFERRTPGDVVIEAVIVATKKPPGPPPPQLTKLVYKRPAAISPKAMEHLPHQGEPKRVSTPT
jgi:hypothetical protein